LGALITLKFRWWCWPAGLFYLIDRLVALKGATGSWQLVKCTHSSWLSVLYYNQLNTHLPLLLFLCS